MTLAPVRFTLESAFASVEPVRPTTDLDEEIAAAKDTKAARLAANLSYDTHFDSVPGITRQEP
ncbi:MAG: hypothetical protein U0556_01650 [Dehalococcoidia bacterium]